MKKLYALLILSFAITGSHAQMNKNISVLVNARADANAKTIDLYWPKFKDASKVDLYQKNFTTGAWELKKTRTGKDSGFFKISNLTVGTTYEFQIAKTGGTGAWGYIYTSINKEETHAEGKILLLIDSSLYAKIPKSIAQYELDLICSGWKTEKVIVSPGNKVTDVKAIVKSKTGLRTVVIIGHVAVPYSGYFGCDGHDDHQGAWPADMYYAELDGQWTDEEVTAQPAGGRPETMNVPGDGKFDQQIPTTPVDLEIARIDLTRLPGFGKTDSALHAYYFEKNHFYRTGGFKHEYKALVDDNFTGYEMAAWAIRSYAPIVDSGNVFYNIDNNNYDYNTTLKNNWWMMAGASGPGYYNSCGGVMTSSQFATDSIKTVISGMSGSYFGDWDNSNNILRSALASKPSIQTSFWGGLPAWILHPLALGYSMGYCTKATMNNRGTYKGSFNSSQGLIHIALMGDPSVNIYPVKSATGISMSGTINNPKVNWVASTDNNIVGYNVYRAGSIYGDYIKLNATVIAGNSFTDLRPLNGSNVYMIRAVKKISNASGTHYQMSQGILDSAQGKNISSVTAMAKYNGLQVYPNPTAGQLNIELLVNGIGTFTAEIWGIDGKLVYTQNSSEKLLAIDTKPLTPGMYIVKVYNNDFIATEKIIKN